MNTITSTPFKFSIVPGPQSDKRFVRLEWINGNHLKQSDVFDITSPHSIANALHGFAKFLVESPEKTAERAQVVRDIHEDHMKRDPAMRDYRIP